MEIINNISKTLKEDLAVTLKSGSKISIAASSFSIYAFQELKEQLSEISELRFIFTSPSFVTEKVEKEKREFYIPRLNRERDLYGSEFEIKLRNELSLKAVAKECAEWIKNKVCFKSNRTDAGMPAFAIVDDTAYQPLNGFTTVELGCEKGNNIATVITKMDNPFSKQYLQVFNDIWNDKTQLQEVTDKVLDNITNAYKENSPEFIYFLTLYNIFKEFLEDISEDVLPNEATGFKNSEIWNKLYSFQKDASLAIINKLEKFNGCILADSVGLGKTFTTLSVIKYYENRNKSVLVLCPKKLYNNWVTYRSNYKNNTLSKDRLRYDILYHTDLSRNTGISNGLDLDHLNWGNYDLVVIDESHNFRNGGKITTSEIDDNDIKENRYLQLLNKVIRSGVKTKVLMLSATPVNNKFTDLRNQLALAYEGDSAKWDELLKTSNSIEEIFKQAQKVFNTWSKLPDNERTTKNLLDKLSFDFFEVLDSVTIARSRKHIQQYYNMEEIGTFPNRLTPISRTPQLTDIDDGILEDKTFFDYIAICLLNLFLDIYTPSNFILPSKREKYGINEDNLDLNSNETPYIGLSQSGREEGIRKLMRSNLLKRLESSINSFRLTVKRIRDYIEATIQQIEKFEKDHLTLTVEEFDFDNGLDYDDQETTSFVGGKKGKIDLADMDYTSWKNSLESDLMMLDNILDRTYPITPEHDIKLQTLIKEIKDKVTHPINKGNKKIIIFTAFSDTAQYLYENIAERILKDNGLHTALISGDVEARTTLKIKEKLEFNKVLSLFSPISKEKETLYPNIKGEIDILIATDCISEGQNLQDCDYLINYDIHWNPVRIIQRFGRIDRIGSRNKDIQLVNYWPTDNLDHYIDLRSRVYSRMKITDLSATGDDNLLDPNDKIDNEYRHKQLQKLKNEVVDVEEMSTGISIMDLGLNEFRLDLLKYMKEYPDIESMPMGMHAIINSTPNNPTGVIFVLKNRNKEINTDKKNRLHPFYLVYISKDSDIIVNYLEPKDLLDRMRQLCKGKDEPMMDLCRKFNSETRDGQRMGTYSKLLGEAISSIVKVKEQSDLFSFLEGDPNALFGNTIHGLDDFELICFLIIR